MEAHRNVAAQTPIHGRWRPRGGEESTVSNSSTPRTPHPRRLQLSGSRHVDEPPTPGPAGAAALLALFVSGEFTLSCGSGGSDFLWGLYARRRALYMVQVTRREQRPMPKSWGASRSPHRGSRTEHDGHDRGGGIVIDQPVPHGRQNASIRS
jgi:hypothetical protein